MSEQAVATVLRCYEAYNRHDAEAALADFHPDAVFQVADSLDKPLVYTGRDAIRELFTGIWTDWADDRSEPRETLDLGDTVLVRAAERRVGRDGVVVEIVGGQVWKFDADGLITRYEAFDTWDDALEAAGLS